MKRNHNKGLTLVELIVVIAIMAVLSGIILYSINLLGYADTVKCANRINSALSSVRLNTMSRTEEYVLYLYQADGSCYMRTVSGEAGSDSVQNPALTAETGTRVGSGRVTISVRIGEGDYQDLSDTEPVAISFHKNSGAFQSAYTEIRITGGGKVSYVRMALMTGKHYVE